MSLSYILNELGEDRELYFNAIAPPIMQTSNFAFKTVDALRKNFEDEMSGYLYSRGINPTIDILRKKLAALDGAEDALVFNSGAAAIYAAVVTFVKTGDHIVSVRQPYTWAQKLFDHILPRFGITTTYIDGTRIEHFEAALQPNTALIYTESPNSWTYELQDLAAVAQLARSKGIITVCDNSYCTPLYQQPVKLGIDLALQSATKYIGGHSDTVAGVLTGSAVHMRRIFELEYLAIGSGIQPFNAWLLIRGLRTLQTRLERISATTAEVVNYLKQHPQVEQVIFPFDPAFPQYELAKRQMSGACGLCTVVLKASEYGQVQRFCESLKHIMMAVSWGGHESLIIPKCAGLPAARFDAANPQHRMIRLYAGLEDAAYIIADLEQALAAMNG
jgi:cystathionine beta-lyase/cystathionine gamma-synthase